MKTICVSQPRYLPSVNYVRRFNLCDEFIYLDTVKFSPRDFENRNRILINGEPLLLTIPIVRDEGVSQLRTTRINYEQEWMRNHLETLRHAYSWSSHYDSVVELVRKPFAMKPRLLSELNMALVAALGSLLRPTRSASSLGVTGQGEDLLIAICKAAAAERYLSGPLGRNYITPAKWSAEGIEVIYDDAAPVPYLQRKRASFVPYMAVYDLLFNVGSEKAREWLR